MDPSNDSSSPTVSGEMTLHGDQPARPETVRCSAVLGDGGFRAMMDEMIHRVKSEEQRQEFLAARHAGAVVSPMSIREWLLHAHSDPTALFCVGRTARGQDRIREQLDLYIAQGALELSEWPEWFELLWEDLQ